MNATLTATRATSKYIKVSREKIYFYRCAVLFIFALYVMPQYFGIPTPFFDLTSVRIMIVFLLIFIISDYDRSGDFADLIKSEKITYVLLPYMIVILYTMVFRADINAFINPFIEILEMYLMIYVIRDCLGVDKTMKLVLGFIYFLVILGIFEAIVQVSPFSYLVNLSGLYTGRFVRGGHYRIMSSAIHSLGYGMLLMTAIPFAAIDVEKKEFNVFKRPVLLALMVVNIFLTGSRSTLGIMFLELFLMFVFSDRKFIRKNILFVIMGLVLVLGIFIAIRNTSVGQYILLQLTSVIDALIGTELAVNYGANLTALAGSTAYRRQLLKVFSVSWLNPLLGIGRNRSFSAVVNGTTIKSVDNFYLAEYIRYAYPGLVSYVLFLVYMGLGMLKDAVKTRSAIIRVVLIGAVSYCIHLYIADSLMTFKYLYLLFAIYLCCDKTPYIPEKSSSKYIKSKALFANSQKGLGGSSRYVKK